MKFNWKFGLISGMYVGFVYAVGSYLGYRIGKSQGRIEAYIENIEALIDLTNDISKCHPNVTEEEA